MNKHNFIYGLVKKTLPFLMAASLYAPSTSFSARGKTELPDGYSFVRDNSTGKNIDFKIYYSGEEFRVRMIETEKRGVGEWRPWFIEGKKDGWAYVVGRNNDSIKRVYGMPEQEFYSKLSMAATVAYNLDEKSNYAPILRSLAKEFRQTAAGNIYLNAGGQVFDLAGIAGGILVSKAAFNSNPGAVVLAGKQIRKMVINNFMSRSYLPKDAPGTLNATEAAARYVRDKIITENTTKLYRYADELDKCASILETHDLKPYTLELDWDYNSAKEFYDNFSVSQPEGLGLNCFLKEIRGKETQLDVLSKRAFSSALEGVSGVSLDDILRTANFVIDIFDHQPVKKGLDRLTEISRRNKKEFLSYVESRFDITPGRRTDANAFLNADWPEYSGDIQEEEIIKEEKQDVLVTPEKQYNPNQAPRDNGTITPGNLEDRVQENPIPRAQNEPEIKKNVYLYSYDPKSLEAGISGTIDLFIENDNDFTISGVDISDVEAYTEVTPGESGGLIVSKTRDISGGILVTEPIEVLEANKEGRLKLHYRVERDAILGPYKVVYKLVFHANKEEQITPLREFDVEVYEEGN